jgi:hypothetical protein
MLAYSITSHVVQMPRIERISIKRAEMATINLLIAYPPNTFTLTLDDTGAFFLIHFGECLCFCLADRAGIGRLVFTGISAY